MQETAPRTAPPPSSEVCSTTADALEIDATRLHRGVWWRRAFTLLLFAFVVAAAVGVFGIRTRTVAGSKGPLHASLEYASANRRGVTTAFRLAVTHDGGFSDDVTVLVSADYMDSLAFRGMDPDADQSSANHEFVSWSFTKPTGDTFQMHIDAQIDASTRFGRHAAEVVVLVGDGAPVTLHFTTWVFP